MNRGKCKYRTYRHGPRIRNLSMCEVHAIPRHYKLCYSAYTRETQTRHCESLYSYTFLKTNLKKKSENRRQSLRPPRGLAAIEWIARDAVKPAVVETFTGRKRIRTRASASAGTDRPVEMPKWRVNKKDEDIVVPPSRIRTDAKSENGVSHIWRAAPRAVRVSNARPVHGEADTVTLGVYARGVRCVKYGQKPNAGDPRDYDPANLSSCLRSARTIAAGRSRCRKVFINVL